MFKRYELKWPDGENTLAKTTFYVHRKARRNNSLFIYRAIAVGAIPRLDGCTSDYAQYQKNNDKLEKMRRAKVAIPVGKLCLVRWQGKHVLCKLWEQLAKLPFTDMMAIGYNPFDTDEEPDHDVLVEPEDVFG